jgi:hypothetical protein
MSNENLANTISNMVEGVSDEAEAQDETLEVAVEATEEEVVAEQSTESDEVSEEEVSEEEVEEVIEAKAKTEEDEEEVEETATASIPKTKAGVINAAVEMLKKARKHEAQQLFARMIKNAESTDDGSVHKAIDAQGKKEKDKTIKAKSSDASAKQESADWEEDLDLIVANEATLSD